VALDRGDGRAVHEFQHVRVGEHRRLGHERQQIAEAVIDSGHGGPFAAFAPHEQIRHWSFVSRNYNFNDRSVTVLTAICQESSVAHAAKGTGAGGRCIRVRGRYC
jgi:hypothetical protein